MTMSATQSSGSDCPLYEAYSHTTPCNATQSTDRKIKIRAKLGVV